MKYFQHMADSVDDPFLKDARRQFGSDGYALFFIVLELMTKNFNEKRPGFLRISVKNLRDFTGISVKKAKKIFVFCETFEKFFVKYIDGQIEMVEIFCPKFNRLYDEHTKRIMKNTTEPLRSDSVAKTELLQPPRESYNHNQNQNQKKKEKQVKESVGKPPSHIKSPEQNIAQRALDYLNECTKKNFRNTKPIPARVKELLDQGFQEEECFDELVRVIDNKVNAWGGDVNMAKYLRPTTLFGPEKFDEYRNEVIEPLVHQGNPHEMVFADPNAEVPDWPDDNFQEALAYERAMKEKKENEERLKEEKRRANDDVDVIDFSS